MRYMIFPYKQNSEGAIAIAKEMDGQRILREGSKYRPQDGDVIINWGASDCPFKQALNHNNRAVLNKLSFFDRLQGLGLTPLYAGNMTGAAQLTFPVFCRTRLKGRDGAGIVVAHNASQLVPCDLYVQGVPKTSEYRVHLGRLASGEVVVIGSQKKIYHPTPGYAPEVWAGEGTNFVWTVNGQPAHIPGQVTTVAISAFARFPELTFGAFDVVFCSGGNNASQAFVLEINSAPTVTPETAKRYGVFFRKLEATSEPSMATPAVTAAAVNEEPAQAAPVATPPPAPVAAPAAAAPMLTVELVRYQLDHGQISLENVIQGYVSSIQ